MFHLKYDRISKVDNPGEVVRITPKKGEVDYQGVHAKARPGTCKDHDENEDIADEDDFYVETIFSDITLSSASLTSAADTDDLSSLGVPVYRPKYAFFQC